MNKVAIDEGEAWVKTLPGVLSKQEFESLTRGIAIDVLGLNKQAADSSCHIHVVVRRQLQKCHEVCGDSDGPGQYHAPNEDSDGEATTVVYKRTMWLSRYIFETLCHENSDLTFECKRPE